MKRKAEHGETKRRISWCAAPGEKDPGHNLSLWTRIQTLLKGHKERPGMKAVPPHHCAVGERGAHGGARAGADSRSWWWVRCWYQENSTQAVTALPGKHKPRPPLRWEGRSKASAGSGRSGSSIHTLPGCLVLGSVGAGSAKAKEEQPKKKRGEPPRFRVSTD